VQAAVYLQQSAALLQSLGDRQGMVSSLATLALCGAMYLSEIVVTATLTVQECLAHTERARQIAVEIGLRSGEVYTWIGSAYALGTQGQYGRAIEAITQGIEIAQEIGHREWLCYSYRHLGAIYLDLLALPEAQNYMSQALALAQEIGSGYHTHSVAGYLLSIFAHERDFVQAETLIATLFREDLPIQTIGQRRLWLGRAELALAQGDPELGLQIVDRLMTSTANFDPGHPGSIPYLAHIRSEALMALQRRDEAETTLLAARATSQARMLTRFIWKIDIALGKLYQAQGRFADASALFAAAHEVVHSIALSVPDSGPNAEVRVNFLRQSLALFSSPQVVSPAGHHTAGLTRREIEVLRLVAQGATNRQIGAALHISERTVNTHLTNILNKIGCDNRTAAAAFAVQQGLA
jgi:DNA-binding CsgD family transcriptional regulator/tetratricopeptide (TPR) repeat protein